MSEDNFILRRIEEQKQAEAEAARFEQQEKEAKEQRKKKSLKGAREFIAFMLKYKQPTLRLYREVRTEKTFWSEKTRCIYAYVGSGWIVQVESEQWSDFGRSNDAPGYMILEDGRMFNFSTTHYSLSNLGKNGVILCTDLDTPNEYELEYPDYTKEPYLSMVATKVREVIEKNP